MTIFASAANAADIHTGQILAQMGAAALAAEKNQRTYQSV